MNNLPIVNAPYENIQGLHVAYGSNTTITVESGKARDSDDSNDILVTDDVTVNLASTGANGLDQGSLAASTLYNVFAVGDSTKYNDGCVVASVDNEPLLPFGYDMWRLIGHIKTDGSSHVLPFRYTGNGVDRNMMYNTPVGVLTNGNDTSFTDIDCSASVPSGSTKLFLLAAVTPSAAGRGIYLRPNGSSATDGDTRFNSTVSAVEAWGEMTEDCDSDGVIEYKVDNGSDSVDLSLRGYVDSL